MSGKWNYLWKRGNGSVSWLYSSLVKILARSAQTNNMCHEHRLSEICTADINGSIRMIAKFGFCRLSAITKGSKRLGTTFWRQLTAFWRLVAMSSKQRATTSSSTTSSQSPGIAEILVVKSCSKRRAYDSGFAHLKVKKVLGFNSMATSYSMAPLAGTKVRH